MSDKYVLATDDNGNLAVRTVTAEESPTANSTDVITATTDGKLAVRVVGSGGGGGDQHNLGWYATESALTTAHPTASDGDYAIVGDTDTVWVWDSDNNEWKDTDQKGQVESVNGQTGTVVLTASDVGAATTAQGAKADTAVQPGDLATVATTGQYSDLIGKPTIPTVGDGTITITQGGVTKGTFTTNQSGNTTIEVDAGGGSGLPDQTGQSGKFLTTDGTDASWSDKPLVNTATQSGSLVVGNNAQSLILDATAFGANTIGWGRYGSAFGKSAIAKYKATALGANTTANEYTIQLGQGGTNSDAGTMKVALTTSSDVTTNYELMSADGTIPAARHAALPAADGTYTLQLVITNGVPTLSWVAE